MKKLTALLALGVGYVLGSRAGRARYEQIKQQADKAWHHPKVQEQVTKAEELAKSKAGTAGTAAFEKAKDAATSAAAAAKTKAADLRGHKDATPDPEEQVVI